MSNLLNHPELPNALAFVDVRRGAHRVVDARTVDPATAKPRSPDTHRQRDALHGDDAFSNSPRRALGMTEENS